MTCLSFLALGDVTARAGTNNTSCEEALEKYGFGINGDNGVMLVEFCPNTNHVIGSSTRLYTN